MADRDFIFTDLSLDDHRLPQAPSAVYYIPEFVSVDEEEYLIRKVNDAPKPKWTQLSNRRLQNWGGEPHPQGMITEPIPEWLKTYMDRIYSIPDLFPTDKRPNHVLVNEYLAGQGIMPHLDGPRFHPIITTISLGSHTVLNFYEPLAKEASDEVDNSVNSWERRLKFKLLVEPRSLLILQDDAYNHFLHGIEELKVDNLSSPLFANRNKRPDIFKNQVMDRDTRISLTIRCVPGAKKSLMKLLGR